MSGVESKAISVDKAGAPDGFEPGTFYRPEVISGGHTRLAVSLPPERLGPVFRALVATLEPPLKVLYVQLTDRQSGTQLPKPKQHVTVEKSREAVLGAIDAFAPLIFEDGRHQLWLRSSLDEQLVLEEIGMVYVYPDDPLMREILEAQGVPRGDGPTMAERDYVRVRFDAANDAAEGALLAGLGLVPWAG